MTTATYTDNRTPPRRFRRGFPAASRIPLGFVEQYRDDHEFESMALRDLTDAQVRNVIADLLPTDAILQDELADYLDENGELDANGPDGRMDARILRVRDFASSIPSDFGDAFRDDILDTCLAAAFLEEKGIDEATRQATFVLTDPSVDSYREIIDAGAFDASLAQYMRNPVVLPEHRHAVEGEAFSVVGKTVKVFKRGKSLLGTIQFGRWPIGEYRWTALLDGCLRAVSVGFRPVTTERDKDGVLHYTEAKLKEVSTVAVGANDNALLVNSYLQAHAAQAAARESDTGRAAELAALVEELRADIVTAQDAIEQLKRRRDPVESAGASKALADIDATIAGLGTRTGGSHRGRKIRRNGHAPV